MHDTEHIGPRLKQFRIERDYRLEQIADILKVSVGTVWKIENGKVRPNDRTLYKIRKAFPTLFEGAA